MALQSSGTITIQDIVDEFGGTAPHSLSEYYRNGTYVGSTNTGVPTSGTIALSDFYGASAATVVTVTEGTLQSTSTGSYNYGYIASGKYWDDIQNRFYSIGTAGSRTPTTLNGATIQNISRGDFKNTGTTEKFIVVLSGTRSQSFFTSVTPQGGTTLNTASTSRFRQVSGSTVWVWNADFTTWDGTGTRTATFV